MRRKLMFSLSSVLVLALASCMEHREGPKPQVQDLDRKLSTFAFIEEGKLVSLIVGTKAARYRGNELFFPLEVCIANRGLKRITLTREAFTLRDSDGNEYSCAGPKELMEKYEFLDLDRRLGELADIVFNRFNSFTRYESNFSPTRTVLRDPFVSSLVQDKVAIPEFGYIIDFVYFPVPKSGILNQRLELFIKAPELPDPVFAKFAVL